MNNTSLNSTAADVLVSSMSDFGIDRAFTVAGESYLGLLDALYDSSIDVVTCRQEGGAGFMALADARMTRLPGVCIVSRGGLVLQMLLFLCTLPNRMRSPFS